MEYTLSGKGAPRLGHLASIASLMTELQTIPASIEQVKQQLLAVPSGVSWTLFVTENDFAELTTNPYDYVEG